MEKIGTKYKNSLEQGLVLRLDHTLKSFLERWRNRDFLKWAIWIIQIKVMTHSTPLTVVMKFKLEKQKVHSLRKIKQALLSLNYI